MERERGSLLELSVTVDGRDAYDGGLLAYPRPRIVVDRVRDSLDREVDAPRDPTATIPDDTAR